MKVSSKVICINDDFSNYPNISRDYKYLPIKGEEYTIRECKFDPENNKYRVVLEELNNPEIFIDLYQAYLEPGFDSTRFVPIDVFENIEYFANEMVLLNQR